MERGPDLRQEAVVPLRWLEVLAPELGKLGEQLDLALGELFGCVHLDVDVEVAAAAATQVRDALGPTPQDAA